MAGAVTPAATAVERLSRPSPRRFPSLVACAAVEKWRSCPRRASMPPHPDASYPHSTPPQGAALPLPSYPPAIDKPHGGKDSYLLFVVHIAAAIHLPIAVPKPIQRRQQPLLSDRSLPASPLSAPPNSFLDYLLEEGGRREMRGGRGGRWRADGGGSPGSGRRRLQTALQEVHFVALVGKHQMFTQ
uniref:Uncharacterized protein n=1 Tax=Leersia perrieri TaxID=77586 RepID=A0A0D9VNA1_9ORYZ